MKPRLLIRSLANLANLSTPLGLAIGLIGRCGFRRGPGGLVIAENYRLRFPIAGAFTVGNVVLVPGRTLAELEASSPGVTGHEDAHAWQYAYCLGLPFLPAYAIAMGWSWLRTGDRAAANFFERQAGLDSGGYAHLPTRPAKEALAALFRRR
ncbi:MAG: hypothetical protein Q3997_04785 [Propionibacteriaceae bacterium]|nr:hypothetical protein [Propionibacteriaceae bacterium]